MLREKERLHLLVKPWMVASHCFQQFPSQQSLSHAGTLLASSRALPGISFHLAAWKGQGGFDICPLLPCPALRVRASGLSGFVPCTVHKGLEQQLQSILRQMVMCKCRGQDSVLQEACASVTCLCNEPSAQGCMLGQSQIGARGPNFVVVSLPMQVNTMACAFCSHLTLHCQIMY